MSNVFNFIKPSPKLPRNGFDLSQRHIFSAKAGQLLPIMSLECVPGDHHEINVLEMARMVNIHTDAYARLKQNFEFYFVPYSQLFSNFDTVVTKRYEPYSALMDSFDPTSEPRSAVPYVRIDNLIEGIWDLGDDTDLHGFSKKKNAFRLLDLLGYGSFGHFATGTDLSFYSTYRVNMFRALAYQKIYADYYRQSQYESTDLYGGGLDFVYNYNVDDSDGNIDFNDNHPLDGILAMRYRLYKRDLMTGLLPSPQFGDVASINFSDFELSVKNASSTTQNLAAAGTSASASIRNKVLVSPNSTTIAQFSSTSSFSVYDLFKAEALQKWREHAGRAGLHLRDNFKSHYGVDPKYLRDHLCEYVGSFDSAFGIDEVTATADTANTPLGDIGGKGLGTAAGKIKFDATE